MKLENSLTDALTELAELNPKRCLSEDVIFQYVDKEGLDLQAISRICTYLENNGIKIVSQLEYDVAVAQNDHFSKIVQLSSSVEGILKAFEQLSKEDQILCLNMLVQYQNKNTSAKNETIRKTFLGKVEKFSIQYSYIGVLLLSFLNNCNSEGKAVFSDVVHSFWEYYITRSNNGQIIEQNDSIVTSADFSEADAKKLILYNPLRRSFLSEYLKYNKSDNILFMPFELWDSLGKEDIEKIRKTAQLKLEQYYKRLKQKSD